MQPTTPTEELKILDNKRFIDAAKNGDLEEVRSLLNKGVDINTQDGPVYRNTALHYAAQNGHYEVVETLIDSGANFNLTNRDKVSVLMYAAQNGHDKIVELLLEKGADVNLISKRNDTALYLATQNGHDKVVELILEKDVDLSNRNGDLTLYAGAVRGFDKIVKLLLEKGVMFNLEKGVMFNLEDWFGLNPLHDSATKGHLEVVELLLEKGMDVNFNNARGESTLILVIENGHVKVVNSLLEAGADVNFVATTGGQAGRTAIEVVARSKTINEDNKQEIFSKLFKRGAILRPEFFNDDNIADKVLLNALKSITAEELANTNEKNLDKLKESGVYPLLKIMNNLSDDEIILSAKNLKDFKAISNKISMFKNFSEKESGPIQELTNDIMSKILVNSFPINLKEGMGEELTSKLIINLLEMHSASTLTPSQTSQSAQSSQIAGSSREAPRSPSSEPQARGATKLAKQEQERD